MNLENIYTELKNSGTAENVAKYKKQGAKGEIFGVSINEIERIKKDIISAKPNETTNHQLALELWKTRNVDSRILACMIADPQKTTRNLANKWVSVINYYLIADHLANLVAQTRFGQDIMYLWIQSPDEYVKRTGFMILNYLAKNDTSKSDLFFKAFLQKIKQEIQFSNNWAKEAMYECLISIASKDKALKEEVLNAIENIGSIEINVGNDSKKTIHIIEEIKNI